MIARSGSDSASSSAGTPAVFVSSLPIQTGQTLEQREFEPFRQAVNGSPIERKNFNGREKHIETQMYGIRPTNPIYP